MSDVDYSFWRNHSEYSLLEAAYLFCDIEPKVVGKVENARVLKMARSLANDLPLVIRGRNHLDRTTDKYVGTVIVIDEPRGGERYVDDDMDIPWSNVCLRSDLIEWGGKNKIYPKFLFSETLHKTLNPKEKNTYLVLIAALLKEKGIDPYKRGVSTSIQAMVQQLGADMDETTIRSKLGEIRDLLETYKDSGLG